MRNDLLSSVVELALDAGRLIEQEVNRPGGPRGHADKADVDLDIERVLRERLIRLIACDFVGEETGSLQTNHPYCWVVDPNDGTRDFLAGRTGSAISVGLLHKGMPCLGVVYAPLTERGPDCIGWQLGLDRIIRNGREIEPSLRNKTLAGSVVFVSTAATSRPLENAALCAPGTFEPMPSVAYRLARTAVGDGVAGVSIYPVSPHDVVAGHALVRAAGGDLLDQDGHPIRYTKTAQFSSPVTRCFGGSAITCRELASRHWSALAPL